MRALMVQGDLIRLLLRNAEAAQHLAVDGDAVGVPVGRGDGEKDVLLLNAGQDVVGQQDVADHSGFRLQNVRPQRLSPKDVGDEPKVLQEEEKGGKGLNGYVDGREIRLR